ncbi:MAG: hypothetical protein FWC54_01990, partial [Actinomycetia bacterium]|nr:hypothetical protein [Actinomycetes bacterium]
MSYGLLIAVELLAIIVCCGVLPAVVLHFLMKAFARRSAFLVKNYVGRAVPLGLGFVWPLWGIGALLLALMVRLFPDAQYEPLLGGPARLLGGGFLGWAIAIGAVFAFGLIDDLGGAGISKGFKGHLKALGHGKLTTGMIKLIGIGITALLFSRYYFMY